MHSTVLVLVCSTPLVVNLIITSNFCSCVHLTIVDSVHCAVCMLLTLTLQYMEADANWFGVLDPIFQLDEPSTQILSEFPPKDCSWYSINNVGRACWWIVMIVMLGWEGLLVAPIWNSYSELPPYDVTKQLPRMPMWTPCNRIVIMSSSSSTDHHHVRVTCKTGGQRYEPQVRCCKT